MRKVELIMNDWIFNNRNGKQEKVNLPHTWNNVDGQDGGNDYWRGELSYEKDFAKPVLKDDERLYIQFDGVNASAKVILNDKEVIKHDGGYSTFRADITDLLKTKNHLKVFVDNSVNDRVYPQKADFTFYGGIYRNVSLITVNKDHFDMDYLGGPGIKVDTQINGKDAIVTVKTYFANKDAKVLVDILDADGKVVASGRKEEFEIKNVHLWNGIKDPYLYQARAKLIIDKDEKDEISTTFGVRSFVFHPQKGFFLNGVSYPLHGVSRHQDRKGLGNAITYEHMEEDMALIREVGANTIRLAHYQHNQYFYDLCDKYGMVIWAEIPYISEHLPNARENTISQMKELIIQNYNHPSIVTWGVSNEITIKVTAKKDMWDNHEVLNKLVHDMDPTRPTTMACYAMCGPFNHVSTITDLVGWNLYLGWYVPFMWLNDAWLWFFHLTHPNKCLCYSEYGCEGMPNLHSNHPKRGDNTEEYDNKYHEFMLRCFKRHPWMWGTYVWNMFDFAADARNQGGEPGMNHKGLVTFDRKTKKDAFYVYKAYWSEDSFVYIAGRRFKARPESTTTITVYSNQEEVSLYNNGTLVATKKGDKVFKFKVALGEGENKIEAVSGKLKDNATFTKVDKLLPEYILKKNTEKSQNWTTKK